MLKSIIEVLLRPVEKLAELARTLDDGIPNINIKTAFVVNADTFKTTMQNSFDTFPDPMGKGWSY